LLLGVAISTYGFTRAIANSQNEKKRHAYLLTNCIAILLPLFFFKYFGEINNAILALLTERGLHWPLPELTFLLPVGISFYTFVAIGYTIDVYNEDVEAEKNFSIVLLFISFFPLILSGPIERATNMIPQFKNPKPISYDGISDGMKLMLWGYFMKLVVADRLGIYINEVYNNIPNHNGNTLLLASALYPFQVYTDLGGYSLIAIGTARVMGIEVMQNFKRPFFATSMAELWRRWHISLITWLTDYVYTPLAFYFRKYKMRGVVVSIFVTFLISGIWHGASLTFVVWGLMQGFYLSVEALTQKRRTQLEQKYKLTSQFWYIALTIFVTYVLFTASQVFGRAANLDVAFTVYKKILFQHGNIYLDITTLFFALFGLGIVLLKDFNEEFCSNRYSLFSSKYFVVRCSAYVLLLFFTILFGVFSGSSFIYFQF
jgi:D-alanyl-lipoteichoic acid acyltransferase DltB (MBOAT superfamily)